MVDVVRKHIFFNLSIIQISLREQVCRLPNLSPQSEKSSGLLFLVQLSVQIGDFLSGKAISKISKSQRRYCLCPVKRTFSAVLPPRAAASNYFSHDFAAILFPFCMTFEIPSEFLLIKLQPLVKGKVDFSHSKHILLWSGWNREKCRTSGRI